MKARSRAVCLFDLDPELGAELAPERLAVASWELRVHVMRLGRGEWIPAWMGSLRREHLGLLVIDGVLAREVVLEDTVSSELLGSGDVIRPWADQGRPELLEQQVRWQVLADARLAVLGPSFATALLRFPEVNGALIDRVCARSQRLATTQAISHLNSVERRLLALFWHLAERWGRVTGDGIVVPLTLSHRLLGELIGARRPTVTVALTALARDGKLMRRVDATWLLCGDPAGAPAEAVRRVVLHRRRLLHEPTDAAEARRVAAP